MTGQSLSETRRQPAGVLAQALAFGVSTVGTRRAAGTLCSGLCLAPQQQGVRAEKGTHVHEGELSWQGPSPSEGSASSLESAEVPYNGGGRR